jgi:uncharacterized membrane protein
MTLSRASTPIVVSVIGMVAGWDGTATIPISKGKTVLPAMEAVSKRAFACRAAGTSWASQAIVVGKIGASVS